MSALAPDRILHADWSVSSGKRRVATAVRSRRGWRVEAVRPWADADRAALLSGGESLLAGFDFPVGVPRAYARRASVTSFPELLPMLGRPGRWSAFYDVCATPDEVSLHRPFYPRNGRERGRRSHLEAGLGLSYPELLRACERATATRRSACSLFWLTGPQQVGRAAIHGWGLIARAVERGAALWPFHGRLPDLIAAGGTTIAEAYPAEFYGRLGLPTHRGPGRRWSKRRQVDRARVVGPALAWADRHGVEVHADVTASAEDGFGRGADGEDRFDALIGVLGMIAVLMSGEDRHPDDPDIRRVEGWILGQEAGPLDPPPT
jgi:hypothetical protein